MRGDAELLLSLPEYTVVRRSETPVAY